MEHPRWYVNVETSHLLMGDLLPGLMVPSGYD